MTRSGLVLGMALLLDAAPWALSQSVPVFGTKVEVVAVPVFVTDKAGKAVAGLTAADFEIEDQGRKVPIAAFVAVDAGAPAAEPPDRPVLQAASRRQFLLLFDLTFSDPSGILKARKAALEFVRDSLAPADLVAVGTFGPSGANILVGFTSDRGQVGQAIDTLGVAEGQRLRDPLDLAFDLKLNVQETPTGLVFQDRVSQELRDQLFLFSRSEQQQYRQRVDGFVGGLGQLARALDSLQGRKQVILMSAGFDQSVLMGAEGAQAAENARAVTEGRLWEVQGESHFGDAQARLGLEQVFRTLAGSDTVIHTVDVGGLATDTDVQGQGRAAAGRGRESLAQLALGSRGRFVRETNDLAGALREVADASRYYYILAFEAAEAGKAGKLRKLSVRVKRSGLQVSHRPGYALPDLKQPADPATRRLQAAEAIAKGFSGGAFELRAVAVPYRNAAGRVSLPVVLEVEGRGLLGGGTAKELRLEVYGYALDGEGRIYDALGVTPVLDLGKLRTTIEDKGVQVLTSFAVAEGPADLRFLVRDAATGRAASLRLGLAVPPFDPQRLWLSPPLFMDDPRSRVVLPVASRANPSLEIPFRLEDTAFTPAASPLLQNGVRRELCVMAFGIGSTAPEVTAELVSGAGVVQALETLGAVRVVADADGARRLVLVVLPKGVASGEHTLRVSLRDPATAQVVSSEQAVRVP